MGLGKVLTVLTELVFSAPKHPSHPLQNPCSTRTFGSCRSFVISSVISDWPLCTTRRATDQSLSLAWVLTEDKMSGLVCVGRPGSIPTFLLLNIVTIPHHYSVAVFFCARMAPRIFYGQGVAGCRDAAKYEPVVSWMVYTLLACLHPS